MTLVPYPIVRLMCDVRYAGAWFRTDGTRLLITGTAAPLPDGLRAQVRQYKPDIIAALATIPPGCRLPTVQLLAGGCIGCTCGRNKSDTQPIQIQCTTRAKSEAA